MTDPGADAVRILGRYEPVGLPAAFVQEVLQAEIRTRLPPCCARERISVRVPQGIPPHPDNLEWHQDGGGAAGTTHHMVVWASEQPTEIRRADGSIVVADPFDLVWFDNTIVQHRQPRETDETQRWFVAIRCSGALT
jgi:hypothetical protein